MATRGEVGLFRWGIIGSGFVARKFVLGLRQSEDGRPTLVYSRNTDNARRFAQDLGIGEVARDLEEAARSSSVDAFYLATPPTAHREQALACLSQGKPVLIEKPFAPSKAEAEAIVGSAKQHGVFCMEGMWTRFLPLARRLRVAIAEGAIGTPRSLAGSFGVSNTPEDSDNQFRADLGGGALVHRGVYVIAFALDLLGPAAVAASAATIGETGVDEDCSVILRHEGGALATLRASLRAPLPNDLTIEGTHGRIHVHAPIYRPFQMSMMKTKPAGRGGRGNRMVERLRESNFAQGTQQRLARFRGGAKTSQAAYAGNGYHYEADEVARCVRKGLTESETMPLPQSVRMAALMEDARASWSRTSPNLGEQS
jgi:predicted dehydrogenase